MNEKWFKVGKLQSGEAVYHSESGEYAKEMDFTYLVEMSPEELESVEAEGGR